MREIRYRLRVHKTIEPTILYFGTPVAIISSLNDDGSPNLAPMSSAWWLGWSCMLGLGQMGQTSDNLIRTRECVINLPSEDLVKRVDRLALTFGKNVSANVFEVHIVKLHVEEKLLVGDGLRPHIDAVRWRPLIMSFCRFFGLGGEMHPSRLAESDFMKFVTQGTTAQPVNSSGSHEPR